MTDHVLQEDDIIHIDTMLGDFAFETDAIVRWTLGSYVGVEFLDSRARNAALLAELYTEKLLSMLEDEEWGMTGRDRERVVGALAYFSETARPRRTIKGKVSAAKALLLNRAVVGFGTPAEALSDSHMRQAFGHEGHVHPPCWEERHD